MDSASLDLAPTTIICNASLEAGSLPVAEGTATRGKEEVRSLTEVLVLEHIGGEEGGSAICCQNPREGKCSFHGANSQACSTHGNCHIECGALLHKCECNSPTLSPPRQTSFATYPPSWEALVEQVKSLMPVMQPRRPWK